MRAKREEEEFHLTLKFNLTTLINPNCNPEPGSPTPTSIPFPLILPVGFSQVCQTNLWLTGEQLWRHPSLSHHLDLVMMKMKHPWQLVRRCSMVMWKMMMWKLSHLVLVLVHVVVVYLFVVEYRTCAFYLGRVRLFSLLDCS